MSLHFVLDQGESPQQPLCLSDTHPQHGDLVSLHFVPFLALSNIVLNMDCLRAWQILNSNDKQDLADCCSMEMAKHCSQGKY